MQEGRSQGWAGSLSVALPGSLGPSPNCHQNCMLLGYVYDFRAEANHVGWFGLWKTLGFPKAPHLHPYSVSHVSLLPLMPQVFAQPATPSARVASSQIPPFRGQNPAGDSRLYPGLPGHEKSTDGPRNLHRPRYGKRGDEDRGGLVGGGASAWSSWTSWGKTHYEHIDTVSGVVSVEDVGQEG